MAKRAERTRWVTYLHVSTVEQAEKELSLTAQRQSAADFAARHEAVIDHHYVEPGASGTLADVPAPQAKADEVTIRVRAFSPLAPSPNANACESR